MEVGSGVLPDADKNLESDEDPDEGVGVGPTTLDCFRDVAVTSQRRPPLS